MKILISVNAFKGAISSVNASQLIAGELQKLMPAQTTVCPVSDGGDGFLEVLQTKFPGSTLQTTISAPWQNAGFTTSFGYIPHNNSFVIESAKIFGLTQIPTAERHHLQLTSAGLGELLLKLQNEYAPDFPAATKILIGLGGSGINDFGIGAASKFGLELRDEDDRLLPPLPLNFTKIRKIVLPQAKCKFPVELVFDVESDLTGPQGTTQVFAPQKGASTKDCELLEAGAENILSILKRDHNLDFSDRKIGASGGVSLGLSLCCETHNILAKDFILNTLGLRDMIAECDVVITGEGRLDTQSFMNKAPGIIIDEAKKRNKKIVLVCGEFDPVIRPKTMGMREFELKNYFPSIGESIKNTSKGLTLAAKDISSFLICE